MFLLSARSCLVENAISSMWYELSSLPLWCDLTDRKEQKKDNEYSDFCLILICFVDML